MKQLADEIYVIRPGRMDRATKKRVESRRLRAVCISCGVKPQHKRDICTTCHGRFISNAPKGKRKRAVYDADCVRRGLVGENQQGKKKYRNPYAAVSNQVEGQAS